MAKKKQIVDVLESIQLGCETSREVSDFCGLELKKVSAYLHDLCEVGAIRMKKRNAVRYPGCARASHTYEALLKA